MKNTLHKIHSEPSKTIEARKELCAETDGQYCHEDGNRSQSPSASLTAFPSTLTLFPNRLVETDKTDKTDLISNEEFLRTVFEQDSSDARPVLVTFTGNPNSVSARAWYGIPWNPGTELPMGANNYFSLAVFNPNKAGKYRRLKTSFHALYALMLDDIGTKVSKDRLTLPPSWMLETSPGNFQAGYLLRKPIIDGKVADRLMNAIVAAGLCDPGANGPRARLARLPVGTNGKHAPSFVCRLTSWSPESRFSVEELLDGLQLEMLHAPQTRQQTTHNMQEGPIDGDPVWIPRPEENVVIVTLRNRGLYKAPFGEGKHDITCPWVEEHTGQADHGTAYFEPDDTWPIGGFKCLHGHCAHRHIRDLLRVLDIEAESARMKPTIRVMPGEIHRVVDAAERELSQSNRFYQRGGIVGTPIIPA
jgi:hypothetical protein